MEATLPGPEYLSRIAVEQVLHIIIEWDRSEVLLLVFLLPVGYKLLRDLVAQGEVPVRRPDKGVQEVRTVADGIQASDEASHARSEHHVDRDAFFLQESEHSDVCGALGPAAAEDKRNGGPAAPDTVHLGPHARHYDRVSDGIVALETDLPFSRHGAVKQYPKEYGYFKDSSHGCRLFRIVRAFRQACRRRRGCPLRGRRGWYR